MTDGILQDVETVERKLTTAERLVRLEAQTAATHELVREIHAGVGQVVAVASELGDKVQAGGIGALLGPGGLGGLLGGGSGSGSSSSPRDAILGALFKRH